jgi:outer membrane protein OmpU
MSCLWLGQGSEHNGPAMRSKLLGGTALVVTGLAAYQAAADQQLKLGISGFYRASAGGIIGGDQVQTSYPALPAFVTAGQGDFDRTGAGFRQEIRINFKGETTFDNGLTVAALIGVNGENTGPGQGLRQNRSHIDFRGKYGDVRFGEANSALLTDCVADPGNVTANFGVNSPNVVFANGGQGAFAVHSPGGGGTPLTRFTVGVGGFDSVGTCYGIESRGTKIAYFTPSFAGFTLGISYAPSGNTRNASGSQGFGSGTNLSTSTAEDVLSVGADYSHDFADGTSLIIGGGGEWAFSGYTGLGATLPSGARPSTYLLGAQLAFPNGIAIGASGAWIDNYKQAGYAATDATTRDDGWVVAAGASYSAGPLSIGLEGIYSSWQVTDPIVFPNFGIGGHDKIWGASLNGAYALGPGISLEAQVAYFKYESAFSSELTGFFPSTAIGSVPMNYDAVELDTGIAINF